MAADKLNFTQVNRARIQEVERSFGPWGTPLAKPGRVLVGEGRLVKHSRRRAQPKVFFLFSDVLVYGTIIVPGRWYKNQRILRLEDLQLEDQEDGTRMENHWLIRTPRKSFYMAAGCPEEKRAWVEHIADCRDRCVRNAARLRCPVSRASAFAPAGVPCQASALCMRCSSAFTAMQRRHHCGNCGSLVCGACSKQRARLPHIRQRQRVCCLCHTGLLLKEQVRAGFMGNSRGEGLEVSCEEEEEEEEEGEEEEEEEEEEGVLRGRQVAGLPDRSLVPQYFTTELAAALLTRKTKNLSQGSHL